MNGLIQVLTGCIGSCCFGVLYNIRGKRLIAASIGGLLSWSLFLLFNSMINNEPICYFIVAACISLYSEIMARVFKTPTTTFITTSLIPLVPGGALYYTMAYAFESDFHIFLEKALYTLQLASSLALGILVVSAITKVIKSH